MTQRITPQQTVELWKRKRFETPFFAKTKLGGFVKPDKVDRLVYGDHLSVTFDGEYRTWMFDSQAGRDRFLNSYRKYGAWPCGDPHP